MIEPVELVTTLVSGGVIGALMVVMAGIRRIPWRHAALFGVGWGVVFAALRAASFGVDPGILVLIAALGGSLAVRGFDRGEQERQRISDEIISVRSAPPS